MLGYNSLIKRLALAVAMVSLSGCAGKFTLIDRANGDNYTGTTDGSTMSGTGAAILSIEGEEYRGPWIYQASGGSFSFANFSATSNAYATGSAVGPRGMTTAHLPQKAPQVCCGAVHRIRHDNWNGISDGRLRRWQRDDQRKGTEREVRSMHLHVQHDEQHRHWRVCAQ